MIDDAHRQATWPGVHLVVPWMNLTVIFVVVMFVALATTYLPARRALACTRPKHSDTNEPRNDARHARHAVSPSPSRNPLATGCDDMTDLHPGIPTVAHAPNVASSADARGMRWDVRGSDIECALVAIGVSLIVGLDGTFLWCVVRVVVVAALASPLRSRRAPDRNAPLAQRWSHSVPSRRRLGQRSAIRI